MSPQGGFARTLLDHTQDKVAVIDETGTFTYLNRSTERILGFEPEELVGENALEYVHPEDRDRVVDAFRDVITAEGEVVDETVEYRHQTTDESYVWLESRCSNFTADELGGYIVSSRDITDRIEAERERDETASRLTELASQTADVLWMFSSDWSELLFVNAAYEDVYGGSITDLEADPTDFLNCINPADRDAVQSAIARLSAGASVNIEYRVNPNRNYNDWVWVQAEPIVVDGEVERVVGFSRDITDRRRRERQLVVIDHILRHNLRNGLNAVMGHAAFLVDEPTEDVVEHAEVIRQTSEDILETAEKQRDINELFTTPARPVAVDVHAFFEDDIEALADTHPEVTVTNRLPEPLFVRAVPQIEVAICELMDNAAKHAKVEDPFIVIDGAVRSDEVVIEISDDCPPIPETEYRVLTGDAEMDQVYHSTGLGLWLAYWIIDRSDGTIEFDRRDEGGNRATVTLPAPYDTDDIDTS